MKDLSWLTQKPIAHRGLHGASIPENSFASINQAKKHKLPFEIDVQMTSDDQIIVFHDRNLDRMCGKQLSVTTNSYKKIAQYLLLANSEPIPLLSEVLTQVATEVPILLEIKPAKMRHYERAETVYEIIKNYPGPLAVQSFDPKIVKWFKRETTFPTGLILGQYKDKTLTKEKRQFFEAGWGNARDSFRESVPDFVAHDIMRLSPEISETIRAKMPLVTWTVKNHKLKTYAELLADNIIFEQLGEDFLTAIGEESHVE